MDNNSGNKNTRDRESERYENIIGLIITSPI